MFRIDRAAANSASILATLEYTNQYYYGRAKNSHRYSNKGRSVTTSYPPSNFCDIIIDHAKLPKLLLVLNQTKPQIYEPHTIISKLNNDPVISSIPKEYWKSGVISIAGTAQLYFNNMDDVSLPYYSFTVAKEFNESTRTLIHTMIQELKPKILNITPSKLHMILENGKHVYISIVEHLVSSPNIKNNYGCNEVIYNGTTILSTAESLSSLINGVIYKIPMGFDDPGFMRSYSFTNNSYRYDVISKYKRYMAKPDLITLIKLGFQLSNEAAWYLRPINEHILCPRIINNRGNLCKGDPTCKHHDFWYEKSCILLTTDAFNNMHCVIHSSNAPSSPEYESNAMYNTIHDLEVNSPDSTSTLHGQIKHNMNYLIKTEYFNGIGLSYYCHFFTIETIEAPHTKDPKTLLDNFPMYVMPVKSYRKEDVDNILRINKNTKQTVFLKENRIFPLSSSSTNTNKPRSLLANVLYQYYRKNNFIKRVDYEAKNTIKFSKYIEHVNSAQDAFIQNIYENTRISMNKLEATINDELSIINAKKILSHQLVLRINKYNPILLSEYELINEILDYMCKYVKPEMSIEFETCLCLLNFIISYTFQFANHTYNTLACVNRLVQQVEKYNKIIYDNNIPIKINEWFYYRTWKTEYQNTTNFIVIKL